MKNKLLISMLSGVLIINIMSFSAMKDRKKIPAVKAKQIALARIHGATFANVMEFDSGKGRLITEILSTILK